MSRFVSVLAVACLTLLVVSRAQAQQSDAPGDSMNSSGPASPGDGLSSSASPAALSLPTSFSSDGCTAWFDGDYKQCCVQHDIDRYLARNWRERRVADNHLSGCVWRMPGWWHKPLALVMWAGVRVVHGPMKSVLRRIGLAGASK